MRVVFSQQLARSAWFAGSGRVSGRVVGDVWAVTVDVRWFVVWVGLRTVDMASGSRDVVVRTVYMAGGSKSAVGSG